MTITENYRTIMHNIHTACVQHQRTQDSVQLLAVSKTKPLSMVMEAYQCGQRHFGENYLQDALEKIGACNKSDVQWHFIGAIQSNKTNAIAEHFSWVHTLTREKIAQRLNDQRPQHLPPLNVCIQVNISGEANKAGITPEQIPTLAAFIDTCPNLTLKGLMCIPAANQSEATQKRAFHAMMQAKNALVLNYPYAHELSMGMSSDLTLAIACGATIVRIGTDIFGAR